MQQLTRKCVNMSKDFAPSIQTYYNNARILDFRAPPKPNNQIAIFCAHASNNLPEGYSWSENDKKNFAEKHWAWDLGALDTAIYLASGLKCVLAHSLYSRLLVDVNRKITQKDAYKKDGDGNIVELNKDLTQEEMEYRAKAFHNPYYDAIYEVSDKVNPGMIFAIHSFTPKEEGEVRTLEVGIECIDDKEFANKLRDGMRKRGYKAEVNEPYCGEMAHALQQELLSKHDKKRRGVIVEIRNDILVDPKRAPQVKHDTYEVLKEVSRC